MKRFRPTLGLYVPSGLSFYPHVNPYWERKAQLPENKAKVQRDCTKRKNFCLSRETMNRVKRRLREWEKIIENFIPEKGSISRIYKELLHPNSKKRKNLIKNKQRT